VLPHFKEGSSIVNTTSVNAYKGNASLIPYSSTKGAEVRHYCIAVNKPVKDGARAGGGGLGWYCQPHTMYAQCRYSSMAAW
jgi:NAD(P)-dependent dehydrogenase (short-subunit alcohol dehydrogenase family)